MDCLFCKLRDQNAGKHVYEDERCFVLQDLHPQAPVHLLILPKRHIDGPHAVTPEDEALVGPRVKVAGGLARGQGISSAGYRLARDGNAAGGPPGFHLHVHLLGGRQLTWPPG